jgi:hypothetical protein
MSGPMPPLPQYAFMAWCSVETQGQLYIYRYRFIICNLNQRTRFLCMLGFSQEHCKASAYMLPSHFKLLAVRNTVKAFIPSAPPFVCACMHTHTH